ncbi:MAG: hypothetical protein JO301_00340 [Chitinophagaceae bacterium]|nr:hypothetical protein [Chitinophagaceae bacterium]
MIKAIAIRTRKILPDIDWVLLIFLLLIMNVKLVVKVAGLIFIYLARSNFAFGFKKNGSRLPLFYPMILLLGIVNSLPSLFSASHYWLVMLIGIGFWLVSLLAMHQLKLAVDNTADERIHKTIECFLVLNILFSVLNLLVIFREIGFVNPYRYQGLYQKYFIGTGDFIRGVTFDTSITNAIINAAGVFYAICRRRMLLALCCMIVLLMTGSNFTNLATLACLAFLFCFKSDRDQKSIIVIFPVLLAIFLTNISPQNTKYTVNTLEKALSATKAPAAKQVTELPVEQRPDSTLTAAERRYKFAKLYLDSLGRAKRAAERTPANGEGAVQTTRPDIPKPNIHAPEFQHKHDTSQSRLRAIQLMQQLRVDTLPDIRQLDLRKANGKLQSFRNTFRYLADHPSRIVAGNGMGNFSSKLAFKAAGLGIAGGYPANYVYINNDFERSQLSLYLEYFSRDSGLHSAVNTPNSVYIQLLGEYGAGGLLIFVCCYALYFLRRYRYLTYGLPVLLLLGAAFFIDYWFEQLSIVIFFELLLLLNIRESVKRS